MATYGEIVKEAFLDLGVIALGDELDETDLNHGIGRLQTMLDTWADEGLLAAGLFHHTHEIIENNDSKFEYTIGEDGNADIQIAAPPILHSVEYQDVHDSHYRRLTSVDYQKWLVTQDVTAPGCPVRYNYENSFPLARLRFDRRPTPGDGFRITGEGYLTGTITARGEFALPREYVDPVRANLCLQCAPAYGLSRQIDPVILENARMGLRSIRKRNSVDLTTRRDPGMPRFSLGRNSGVFGARYSYRTRR